MHRQIRKDAMLPIVFLLYILSSVTSLSHAAWDIKETGDYDKLDERERRQLGATNAHYTDAFIAECEEAYYKRPEIPFVPQLLQIKEGMTVGDIGCGVGSYTFPIALKAGKEGKVYAVDIQKNDKGC